MNAFEDYYIKQAGNGLHGFSGVRYQKGYGFFGRLLSNAIIPFLKFFGKNALKAGANIASDLVDKDDFSLNSFKESGKQRIKEQGQNMFNTIKERVMSGNGARKYKRRKVKNSTLNLNNLKKKYKRRPKRKIRKTKRKYKRSNKFSKITDFLQ
ncbi:MAG: hypothetical protein QM535_22600 [Limnohabitans sp.]|nr:hypothetical protein [Limnohabitans sp.]